jgi:hypothetical protein
MGVLGNPPDCYFRSAGLPLGNPTLSTEQLWNAHCAGRPLLFPDEDVICLRCSEDTDSSESTYSPRRMHPITEREFEALLSKLDDRVNE